MRILTTTPNYVSSVECSINDGLLSLGHQVYTTGTKAINYAEPPSILGEYDLWIMMDTDNKSMLSEQYYNRPGERALKIIIHCHDRWIDYTLAPDSPLKPYDMNEWQCDAAFVRDWDGRVPAGNRFPVFALDYGCERRYLEACDTYKNEPRENKISFFGTLTTARRQQYLDAMVRAGLNVEYGTYKFNTGDSNWSKWIYGRYTHDPEYYRELCRSMFCFVPFGAGASTMRLAESYAAGCIPVIQKYPDDIIPMYNFQDGINCVLWKTEEELINKVKYWMENTELAEQLRLQCYEYAINNMLTSNVAQYILEKGGIK